MNDPLRLTIRELRVRAVSVPMALPLQTSSGTIAIAPLALIDLHTEEGVTGCAYLFCYTPLVLKPVVQLIGELSSLIRGDAVAPLELERKLQSRFRLLGAKGIAGMALAGIDMAPSAPPPKRSCWRLPVFGRSRSGSAMPMRRPASPWCAR